MAISPGAYLALRRQAAGLSIETVARRIETVPHLAEQDRLIWLRMIEADEMPMTGVTIIALRKQFPFSPSVLGVLDRLHRRPPGAHGMIAPKLCRACGCSELDACNTSSAKLNSVIW